MPTTDLLKTFGLSRNPFTDRTAEKTAHSDSSLYIHSDLRGFTPNDTTYIFFGKRGSGKTTIRLQMEEGYRKHNQEAVEAGRKGHFIVDLSKPGHLTACLTEFRVSIGATLDNWDAAFQVRGAVAGQNLAFCTALHFPCVGGEGGNGIKGGAVTVSIHPRCNTAATQSCP